ncbi:MAG: ABC transporter substrate-binding protein [Prevotella sp.]|nr:ABC transporter substrate-binding protein [Prevotella sp.]
MRKILRYFGVLFLFVATSVMAQQVTVPHKVKKKETIYGIAHSYGITEEQLRQANPGMENSDYQLNKGSIIQIPVIVNGSSNNTGNSQSAQHIRLGVMLPLHHLNNDGKRMVEYYRGVLMACDTLKKEGISTDVYAWNLPEDGNIQNILNDPNAKKCDIIIGPLYSKYMSTLSSFVESNNILLVIPFSIHAPEIYFNRNIFQIYQTPNDLTESAARRCADWFKDYHFVVVDCVDSTSTKGSFTATLRRQLEVKNRQYSLTSLKSTDTDFAKAFVKNQPNMVVLNTARSPELLSALSRLNTLRAANPDVKISMFGYTEWLMYVPHQQENFHKYDVYISSYFYTNLQTPQAQALQQHYLNNFHQDMISALPRFGMAGFDHALFFLRGLHKYGKAFDGAAGRFGYQPVQNPLKFERIGNGGLQNRSYMFIHYKPDHTIETINY